MSQTLEELDKQLKLLEQSFSHIGSQLSQAAGEIEDFGVPPSERLVEELTTARTDFVNFRNKVLGLAESLAILPLPKPDEMTPIKTS